MKNKLSLDLDQLSVESFETVQPQRPAGTVRAFGFTDTTCNQIICDCPTGGTCRTDCTCDTDCGTCASDCGSCSLCPACISVDGSCPADTCAYTCGNSCSCPTYCGDTCGIC